MKATISSITEGKRKLSRKLYFSHGTSGAGEKISKKFLPANAPFENFVQFSANLFDFFPIGG